MNVLDLFSGIGGFSLGLEAAGMRTVAFCERESFCQAVLRKHWPDVPIHDDVRTLDGAQYAGTVDLVCGGYPCQPFSMAGRRGGAEDERHLWPEMLRIIRSSRPRWVVAENVYGHISLGFDEVAASLETEGFTVWPFVVPACAVDAEHKRERLWIVAHSGISGCRAGGLCDIRELQKGKAGQRETDIADKSGEVPADVADTSRVQSGRQKQRPEWKRVGAGGQSIDTPISNTDRTRCEEQRESVSTSEKLIAAQCGSWWISEPNVGRVAHGVPRRVDRLRALGNAVVPQIPFIIGQAIVEFEKVRVEQ